MNKQQIEQKIYNKLSKINLLNKENYENGKTEEAIMKVIKSLSVQELSALKCYNTEYIIVDSNNNWLATDTDIKIALNDYKQFKKMSKKEEEYNDCLIGEEIYLYEAIQLK